MQALRIALATICLSIGACGAPSPDADESGGALSSNDAKILEFRFKGEVLAHANETPRKAIVTQLRYMTGALTMGVKGNALVEMPRLSNVSDVLEDGKKRIRYDVAMSVIWPRTLPVPERYEVVLPRSAIDLRAFNARYDGSCGKQKFTQNLFWHDFNPTAIGCVLRPDDVLRTEAVVAPHPEETHGKYPEYNKVWEDDRLDIVAVYGEIGDADHGWFFSKEDSGETSRKRLLAGIEASLSKPTRTSRDDSSGTLKDETVTGTVRVRGRDRTVNVTAVLLEERGFEAFSERFVTLSKNADIVVFTGHSGVGETINRFASKTGATASKYQLAYLYGCQGLGYLGPEMHANRIALNGVDRDPEGTKFLDLIATALPALGDEAKSTLAIYEAMLLKDKPKTFNDLLEVMGPHLATVFGEHDNSFEP